MVMIVLTGRSKNDFDDALPSFAELIKSYGFVSDKVTTGKST